MEISKEVYEAVKAQVLEEQKEERRERQKQRNEIREKHLSCSKRREISIICRWWKSTNTRSLPRDIRRTLSSVGMRKQKKWHCTSLKNGTGKRLIFTARKKKRI